MGKIFEGLPDGEIKDQIRALGADKWGDEQFGPWWDEQCARASKVARFSKFYWIKDKAGKMRPMGKLKRAQLKVLTAIEWQRKRGEPVRVVVAKSRKMGVSTLIAADCLDESMEKQLDALVIAHDRESTQKIFDIYQRFYRHLTLPKPQPYKGVMSKREMKFDSNEAHLLIQTAGNVYAGTALTPQYMHLSEAAKWEHGQETLISLLQAVSYEAGTTIIFESTFNGREKTFLPVWNGAAENCRISWDADYKVKVNVTNRKEWNGYLPVFIGVLEDEECWLEFESDEEMDEFEQTLDDYETSLVRNHGADLEQINWLRRCLKSQCQNDHDIRKQEFPVTWQEGVRASGRPRFAISNLDSHPVEEGEVGRLDLSDRWTGRVQWHKDSGECLTRFRAPQPGHRYVLGVDTAEGAIEESSRTSDNSVIQVLDLDHGGEQVAVYESRKIHPEDIVPVVHSLAVYYMNAFVIIERNGQGGVVAIEMGKLYPRNLLFHDGMFKMHEGGHRIGQIGWMTHQGNRHKLVAQLADAISENRIVLHDLRTVNECRSFVYRDDGKVAASTGEHDDHVMSLALAVVGMDFYPDSRTMLRVPQYQQQNAWTQARRTADSITGY